MPEEIDKTSIQTTELLKHSSLILLRLDKYIGDANVKGNFIIVLNTLVVGMILGNYNAIKLTIRSNCAMCAYNVEQGTLLILSVIIVGLVLKVVFPFLAKGNSSMDKYHSMIFFESIIEFSNASEYSDKFTNQTEKDILQDITKQIFTISQGLSKKYKLIRYAIYCVMAEIFIIISIILTVGR